MEQLIDGSFIDASMDYIYTGSDRRCFPVCFTCGDYSPFMIYLGNNEKCSNIEPRRIQLFCPVCTPDPDHFRKHFHGQQLYRGDSILNDRKFLKLLNKYVYSNPYYELYSNVDRIIITENTQLCAAYKTVAKRGLPKSFKMKLLMNLFPTAHRLPNKKHTSTVDLCEAVKEKYHEICVSYMDLSEAGGSQLLDNIDFMVDQTPMRERQVSRKTVPFRKMNSNNEPMVGSSVANDLLNDSDSVIRAFSGKYGPTDIERHDLENNNISFPRTDSDDELASIVSGGSIRQTNSSSGSGSSSGVEIQVSSEEVAEDHFVMPSTQSQSSQSTEVHSLVNISSQSVAAGSPLLVDSDSDDNGRTFQLQRTARRKWPSADDGQQAGPSKRPRVTTREDRPMNPAPDDILDDLPGNQPKRYPRLPGG